MLIEKEVKWSMAHRLMHHKELCQNIHGHTYKAVIGIESSVNMTTGMVMDFRDLKNKIKEVIDDLDHCIMVNKDDVFLVKMLHELATKVCNKLKYRISDGEPTAENTAKYIYLNLDVLDVAYVKVYETPTSSATYAGDENE